MSFEKTCPPLEVKLPALNVRLVLKSMTHQPYEPLKLSLSAQGILPLGYGLHKKDQ